MTRAHISALALAACALLGRAAGQARSPWCERSPVPPVGAAPAESASFAALERALDAVALEHGERVRLWSYGSSAEGQSLMALELGAEALDHAWGGARGPTIVVLADLESDAHAGVRRVLDWLELVRNEPSSARAARWLFLPAPLPDRLALSEPAGRAAWDFPAGWDPWQTPGAGAYPLRFPETRALARALAAWPDAATLVLVGAAECRGGGAVEEYARHLGLEVLVPAPGELGEPDPAALARALATLSAVDPTLRSVTALGDELWQLELTLRAEVAAEHVQLWVRGAEVEALVHKGPATRIVPYAPGRGALIDVRMGETRMDFLVRAEEHARIVLAIGGKRCAPRSLEVCLSPAGSGD